MALTNSESSASRYSTNSGNFKDTPALLHEFQRFFSACPFLFSVFLGPSMRLRLHTHRRRCWKGKGQWFAGSGQQKQCSNVGRDRWADRSLKIWFPNLSRVTYYANEKGTPIRSYKKFGEGGGRACGGSR